MFTNANVETAHEILTASERFSDALPKVKSTVPQKDCTRCGGAGYKQWLGPHAGYGPCFKCAGSGKQAATRKGAAIEAAAYAARDVERLRVLYRGLRLARLFVLAAKDEGYRLAEHELRMIDRRIESIVSAGKRAKALLAESERKAA